MLKKSNLKYIEYLKWQACLGFRMVSNIGMQMIEIVYWSSTLDQNKDIQPKILQKFVYHNASGTTCKSIFDYVPFDKKE